VINLRSSFISKARTGIYWRISPPRTRFCHRDPAEHEVVGIAGQPHDLALPGTEARGVLMMTEHRRGLQFS
jgi:hypothetical protein